MKIFLQRPDINIEAAVIFTLNYPNNRYKAGMLKAKVDDPDTVQLIEGAAAGMVATVNRHGPEAVQDWEVDELLDWTTSLNFDE